MVSVTEMAGRGSQCCPLILMSPTFLVLVLLALHIQPLNMWCSHCSFSQPIALIAMNYRPGVCVCVCVCVCVLEEQMHVYWHTDLSMVFLILLKHLNHQLSQADGVLQFFGRGD